MLIFYGKTHWQSFLLCILTPYFDYMMFDSKHCILVPSVNTFGDL